MSIQNARPVEPGQSGAIGPQSQAPPRKLIARLKGLGPGMVLAVTSVGAGDMVTTLNGSSQYGMALTWTVVVGLLIKYALTEAVGRLQLSSRRTLISQMGDISRALPVVILLFMVVIGLFYGAGLSAVAAIAVVELVPGAPMIPVTIGIAIAAGAMLVFGKYSLFERIMVGLAAAMFISIVANAVMVATDTENPTMTFATLVPQLPEGSIMAVLALVGGVGGSAAILAYSYWVREKAWQGRAWLGHLRSDTGISYFGILVFAVATSVLGTLLLHGTGSSVAGGAGLATIGDSIGAATGEIGRVLFLVCLFSVVFSSIIGGFSALGFLIADAIRVLRRVPDEEADAHMSVSSPVFRLVILYTTITAIIFQFAGRPVTMVVIYATISAFILPVLAGSLLVLLNRRALPRAFRNRALGNCALAIGLVLFVTLCGTEIVAAISKLSS
ncbi:MAG: Nramp family divalent metal transporter [Actinomycetota bacterium]|nr:Nramp family divalent metal transporter [Actinomycetota bacterium]